MEVEIEEQKVLKQKEQVDIAEKALLLAKEHLAEKKKEVEKLETHKKEWLKLLRQTQQRGDLPIQSTFKTVAMWNMGQYDAARKLAKETRGVLKQSSLSMPLFIVPFGFDLSPTLKSILQENILAKNENE